MKNKTIFLFSFLTILLLGVFVVSLAIGQIEISFLQIMKILFQFDVTSVEGKIIFFHRLPKSIVAILTGIALPTSGFLLQELFKNPIAGPSVLGISSTAALGVAIFIFLGSYFLPESFEYNSWLIISFAFFGAIVATLLVLLFSLKISNPSNLIVIGFILSAFSGAMISFLEYISPADKIKEYVFWGFGSFSAIDWTQIVIYSFCVFIALFILVFYLKDLSYFMLGNAYAKTLGVELGKLKLILLLIASFLTAVSISFTGPIVFVGIVIPFICKTILKTTNYKKLLAFICLLGMLFMWLRCRY